MCAYIIMSVFMVANMKAKGTPMEHSSVPLTEGLFTVGREQPPHDTPQRRRGTNWFSVYISAIVI